MRGVILFSAVVAGCLALGEADAEFMLIEDFETLDPGPINGQNSWTAASTTSVVATDPADAENQNLSVTTDSTYLYRPTVVLNDTIRMLFFRFRFESQLNCSFGLSRLSSPSQFDDYEAELRITSASNELRIHDSRTYELLGLLGSGTWYNCWMLIDNVNNETQIWLHSRAGEEATSPDQQSSGGQTTFQFRNFSAGDLRSFFIKAGTGAGPDGPLYIDDIYIETTGALNLSHPSAPTSSGWQLPGDCNQDGIQDISDAVCMLIFLFYDNTADLPCGDGTAEHSANLALLDWSGDGDVDIVDPLSMLNWAFGSGPDHPLGHACTPISDCPQRCEQ